jgi:hypothetical protein
MLHVQLELSVEGSHSNVFVSPGLSELPPTESQLLPSSETSIFEIADLPLFVTLKVQADA